MSKIQLIDPSWQIDENVDGIFLKKDQEITSEFLDSLSEDRLYSKAPAKEFHKIASIPVAVVEKWLREGFNIYQESAKSILRKLSAEDLGAFITTSKQI